MIGSAALAVLLAALPDSAEARYRVELRGEHVGWAALSVRCAAERCRARWESSLRLPEEMGSREQPGTVERRVEVETDRLGRTRGIWIGSGPGLRPAPPPPLLFPAMLAELLLSDVREKERRCIEVLEEETGRTGLACARRDGEWLAEELLGLSVRARSPGPGLPLEVAVPEHGARFVSDPTAGLPPKAPQLFGAEVPLARARRDRDLRFCGLPAERTGPPGPAPAFPSSLSGNCRRQTARYLALAADRRVPARHAIGVAWDGRAFVWHEWAELRVAGGWMAVDPAFRQSPAEGPRFTLARFADGDEAARVEAGKQVLSCWGRVVVK